MMHTPKQLCYIPTMGQTLCELCVFQDEQSKLLPARSPWFKWRRSKPGKLCTWVLWTCYKVPRKHWGGVLEAPNIGFVGVTFVVGLKGEEQPGGKWVPKVGVKQMCFHTCRLPWMVAVIHQYAPSTACPGQHLAQGESSQDIVWLVYLSSPSLFWH